MKKEDDEYQFERAQDEIRKGLVHVAAAKELFGSEGGQDSGAPAALSPAPNSVPSSVPTPPTRSTVPASAASAAGDDDDSTVSQIAKLARLHERGILTDAEFEEQKRKLIGE
jgi:hypothetical protein